MKLEDKMKEMIEITKQMNCEETHYIIENNEYKLDIKLVNKSIQKENRKIKKLKKELENDKRRI